MKRILFMFMGFLLAGHFASAQLNFGIKGGVNFANFSVKDEIKLKNSTGWQAGVVAQIKLPFTNLGLQPELLYTVSKADNLELNYFQMPINLRMALLPGPVKPILLAGPYFSYASSTSNSTSLTDLKKFDWGIGLGAGLEIWKIQASMKYSWGLQKISSVGDLKNNVFSISLAYLFF